MPTSLTNVHSLDHPWYNVPFSTTQFATADAIIWEDKAVAIKWSYVSNWFYFNATNGLKYTHQTIRYSLTTSHFFHNEGTLNLGDNDNFFSSDGNPPGSKYDTADPNSSWTHMRVQLTPNGESLTYFFTAFSSRSGVLTGDINAMTGFISRSRGGNILPFQTAPVPLIEEL